MPVTPPNFTQIPNDLLDKMADMSPAEFKVLMAICRKTFGWRKSHDVISLSQLEEMTGLSRTAVQAGIMAGIKRGMLERTPAGKQAFSYHLLVASDYQSTETTSSERLPKPVVSDNQQLVVSDYTQKKELNKGNKSGGDTRERQTAAAAVDQNVVTRLVKECKLDRGMATTYARLHTFTSDELDRLVEWCKVKRTEGKNPAAILTKNYAPYGDLPDDLPKAHRIDCWPHRPDGSVDTEKLNEIARREPAIMTNRWVYQ